MLKDARPIKNKPPYRPGGAVKFLVPRKIAKDDERLLGLCLMINRPLFGLCYRTLLPDFFTSLGPDSGVLIRTLIPTHHLKPDLSFPGDIDLLVIPYDGHSLLPSHTLAVELKVVRASYLRQGKSPNEFGFTQAGALLDTGFPYAAVGHLIVSDASPEHAWREAGITTIKDEAGRCEPIQYIKADMMPVDLISRSIGRLKAHCPDSGIGYFAAYMADEGTWHPSGKACEHNTDTQSSIVDATYDYYSRKWNGFFDTPKWPPKSRQQHQPA